MLMITGTAMMVTGAFLLGFRVGYLLGYTDEYDRFFMECLENRTENIIQRISEIEAERSEHEHGATKPCS